jgi:hypothetical protein
MGGRLDWLEVSTILPQSPGPKAAVPPGMGKSLMLSPIIIQAQGMAHQFLIVSNYTVLKNICILFHITTTSNLLSSNAPSYDLLRNFLNPPKLSMSKPTHLTFPFYYAPSYDLIRNFN